jgi:hypothetical protein
VVVRVHEAGNQGPSGKVYYDVILGAEAADRLAAPDGDDAAVPDRQRFRDRRGGVEREHAAAEEERPAGHRGFMVT